MVPLPTSPICIIKMATPHLRIQVPPIDDDHKTTTSPWLDNADHGPYLLKLARDTIISGESPTKALDYAVRAAKSFERFPSPGVELPMSLHMVAAIYCRLGQFDEAIPVLERSIEVVEGRNEPDHALAKYSGYMQLGDTYSMLGQLDRSISCYEAGLMIQTHALTDSDPKVAETCRYHLAYLLTIYIYTHTNGNMTPRRFERGTKHSL